MKKILFAVFTAVCVFTCVSCSKENDTLLEDIKIPEDSVATEKTVEEDPYAYWDGIAPAAVFTNNYLYYFQGVHYNTDSKELTLPVYIKSSSDKDKLSHVGNIYLGWIVNDEKLSLPGVYENYSKFEDIPLSNKQLIDIKDEGVMTCLIPQHNIKNTGNTVHMYIIRQIKDSTYNVGFLKDYSFDLEDNTYITEDYEFPISGNWYVKDSYYSQYAIIASNSYSYMGRIVEADFKNFSTMKSVHYTYYVNNLDLRKSATTMKKPIRKINIITGSESITWNEESFTGITVNNNIATYTLGGTKYKLVKVDEDVENLTSTQMIEVCNKYQ